MKRFSLLVIGLLIAGCAASSSGPQESSAIPPADIAGAYASLNKSCPPGTPVAQAQQALQNMGFTTTLRTEALVGERSEVLQPSLTRQWHVRMPYQNGKITDTQVSANLVSRTNMRDASTLP